MKNEGPFKDEHGGEPANLSRKTSGPGKDDAACAGPEAAPQTFNERYEALLECLTKEQLLRELIKFHRELTRLKKAEAERQEADEDPAVWRKAWMPLEHALTDIVLIMDPGLRCIYCSSSFFRFTGRSADEMKHRHIAQVLTGSSFAAFMVALTKESKMEQTERPEPWDRRTLNIEFERTDGPAIPASARIALIRDARGQSEEVLLVAHNPLECRVKERALWETKEGYRILFQRAKEPMYIVSVYGTLIDVNDSWEAIFGYHKEEVLGLRVDDVLRLPPGESLWGHPRQRREEESFRAIARKMDGSEIDCLTTSHVWEREDGDLLGYVNIVREWTPRPDTGRKGKAVRTDDFDGRESLPLLAGMIAHQVKGPLAGLLQGVEFVRSSVLDNEILLDALQRIEEIALRVIRVAESLLEFAGPTELKREESDLRMVIERSLLMLDDQMRRKHIEVRKRFAPDVPPAKVDTTQIEEVFANILINATEAVQTHGIIEISLQAEKGEAGSTWVRVTFSDNGSGIPQEDMAKIFVPFFTSKKATGGVGLGLTVGKKIVERHGGTILIEGRAGGGTTVIVRLPAA